MTQINTFDEFRFRDLFSTLLFFVKRNVELSRYKVIFRSFFMKVVQIKIVLKVLIFSR